MGNTYDIIPKRGHFNIYVNGKFMCSADNIPEAEKEIREEEAKRGNALCRETETRCEGSKA